MVYTPEKFYDVLADDYDTMIEFSRRFKNESTNLAKIAVKYNLESALDAGCGTGFHSLILARLGVQVTGLDISRKMLDKLRKNAKRLNLGIKVVQSSLPNIRNIIKERFKSVFCLGNTLVHMSTEKELLELFKAFYSVLMPGGIVVMQILNYDRIINSQNRIQNIKIIGPKTLVRFYDFNDKNIGFNILKIERKKDRVSHYLGSTLIKPWRKPEIGALLSEAGFGKIRFYGDISMSAYGRHKSRDLVALAIKTA